MAGIVPNNPSAFPPSLEVRCTNAAGAWMRRSGRQSFCIPTIHGGQMSEVTTPGKEEVELRQEQQPRAMHDSMARIVPDNPLAFPPSMAVRRRTTARMQEVEQRREHDYTDVGVRVAPGDLQGRRKVEQRRSSCRSSDRVAEAIAGPSRLARAGLEEQLTVRSSHFEQRTPPASCGDFFVFSNAVKAMHHGRHPNATMCWRFASLACRTCRRPSESNPRDHSAQADS